MIYWVEKMLVASMIFSLANAGLAAPFPREFGNQTRTSSSHAGHTYAGLQEDDTSGSFSGNQNNGRTTSYNVQLPDSSGIIPEIEWSQPSQDTPRALVDAIDIVTRRDPSAEAAWHNARAALAEVKGAQWLRFPSITTDLGIVDEKNVVKPSVTVEMPLWAGGQITSSIKRAKTLELAALARWHETVLSLALEVSRTYYDIALYSRLETLYKQSLSEHRLLVDSMQRRVDQQVSPEADLELARSRAAQIEQELASIRSQRISALQTMAELVRDPAYQLGQIPQYVAQPDLDRWITAVNDAVAYSPTRARLIFEADAARSEIAINRGAILPRVSAQYSYNEITGSRVGLGVRVQALNGLSQFSAVASATSRYEQSLEQVRLIERQLRQEVGNEIVTYQGAAQRARSAKDVSRTAGLVSASYMRQFITGRRTWLDVMNSLREHLSAQSSLAQAEIQAISTATRLQLRSGAWRPVPSSREANP